MKNFSKCIIIIMLLVTLTGCGRNYKYEVSKYNETIKQVRISLIEYYESLYELNRILYFEDKKFNTNNKILLKNIEEPDLENYTAVKFSDLNLRINAINALAQYSENLLKIYTSDAKSLTLSDINNMATDIISYSHSKTLKEYSPIFLDSTNNLSDIILENKRYELLKKYVNLTNSYIIKYLTILNDETISLMQNDAEFEVKNILNQNINYYNQYLRYEKPNQNETSKELLRQKQIERIQNIYYFYKNVKDKNPESIITSLIKAQNELYTCVNNPKKSKKDLLTILEHIHNNLVVLEKYLK